jgi:hypothetical protein
MTCPDKAQDKDFQRLVTLLGGSETAAYRMWKYHEHANPGNGSADALKTFIRPASQKIRAITDSFRNLRLQEDTHTYHWDGDSSLSIKSYSAALDDVPEIAHRKTESDEIFADSGTNIHGLFSEIVKIGDPKSPAIKKLATDRGIPDNALEQLFKLKNKLEEMGTLLTEQILYTENTAQGVPIAGTADIIIYGNDGKKYIVDLKTIYHTVTTQRKGIKDIWKDSPSYLRKAKRYSAQVVGYGRMTEWVDQQSVTDHFIVPIEVELNDSKDLSKGYKSMKVREMESVRDLGFMDYATRTTDLIFGDSSFPPSEKSIIGIDDSSQVYTNLTGDISSRDRSPEDLARLVQRGKQNGVNGYYSGADRQSFRPFNDQFDTEAQLQQIVNEHINRSMRVNSDLSYSIKNYLESNDRNHLRMLGANLTKIEKVLAPFLGTEEGPRKDIKVSNLHEIDGFKDKKNWIMIEEGKNTHLLYIGTENLKTRFATKGINNTSVFGKHQDGLHLSHWINSSLENTFGDARKFEGTLIAMKLKEANPTIRFGMTMVYGLGGGIYAGMIDLKETLGTVKQVADDPDIRAKVLTPEMMKLVGKKELLQYENYRADYLDMLSHYIDVRYPGGTSDIAELVKELTDYSTDQSKRKEMFEAIQEYLIKNVDLGRDATVDYETYLLSAFYNQLQGIDASLLPNSAYRTMIAPTQNVLNPMLQKLNVKLQNGVNKMSTRFWDDYKTKYNDALNKFLKTRGFGERIEDRLIGNTPRHYDELYKKMNVKVQTKTGVEEVTVPAFEFWDEGSAEFNALIPEAQSLIKTTNDMIEFFAKENGIKWRRGNLPLVRASVANRFFNSYQTGGTKAYRDLVNNMLLDLESNFGVGEDMPSSSENIFYKQAYDEFVDPRHEMMGRGTDGFVNMDTYYKWSNNLESMMDVFAIQGLRHSVFNEVGASIRAVNSVFKWHKSNLLVDRLDTNIQWTEYVSRVNLDNMDIDSGTALNRGTRLVSRLASFGLYAANPATAAATYLGNEFTLWSESIANLISGSSRFSPSAKTKASAIFKAAVGKRTIDVESLTKIDLLMKKFRLFNEDISSLLNGYHREGDKYMFRSKYMYSMLNGADYATRAQAMIAQLIEDGAWDAYSVVDGKLKYEESKDTRFNGQGKFTKAQSQALRQSLLANLGQHPEEALLSGHDENLGNSIRAYANYLLGSTDRETRSLANFTWWGKLFLGSKSWLPAKIDRWVLGLGDNYRESSGLIGEYTFDVDENGNTVAIWQGEQMEGIIMSWLAMIDNLRKAKDQRKPLTTLQRNNITRSVGDMLIALAAIGIASAIPDDDDETRRDDIASMILRRGADDLLSIYTVMTLDEFLWTPVALSWLNNVMSRSFSAMVDMDPDELLRVTPIANQLDRFYEFTFDSDFELTE